jgi:hypothetical protein
MPCCLLPPDALRPASLLACAAHSWILLKTAGMRHGTWDMGHGTGSHLCFRTALRLLELVIECCHVNEKIRRKMPKPSPGRPSDRQTVRLVTLAYHDTWIWIWICAVCCTLYKVRCTLCAKESPSGRFRNTLFSLASQCSHLPTAALVQSQAAHHVWASETTPCSLPLLPAPYSTILPVILLSSLPAFFFTCFNLLRFRLHPLPWPEP